MREKLIEFIRKADKEDYESRTQDEHYAAMAGSLIANGVTIQKWIPVSERLPEENSDVLCCRGNHIGALMDVYTYKGDGKWEDTYGYWNYTDIEGITHWMPLP